MREFVKDRTGFDGRIGTNWLAQLSKSLGLSVEPWVRALQGTQVRGRRGRGGRLGGIFPAGQELHTRPRALLLCCPGLCTCQRCL